MIHLVVNQTRTELEAKPPLSNMGLNVTTLHPTAAKSSPPRASKPKVRLPSLYLPCAGPTPGSCLL